MVRKPAFMPWRWHPSAKISSAISSPISSPATRWRPIATIQAPSKWRINWRTREASRRTTGKKGRIVEEREGCG
ncbi:hypothetical protein Pyn_09230 [Prunus yedoensis var. nudiflora]|uniref:Uncharacterized protein n=1 Tax=Prunus yedoensis var. nudiflora TaxID=2094558 RepID=A0A314USB5_PRUYE|nr:hypothetical protein Pyn_09230 [Prunus yedoensis var. nudiflora]